MPVLEKAILNYYKNQKKSTKNLIVEEEIQKVKKMSAK